MQIFQRDVFYLSYIFFSNCFVKKFLSGLQMFSHKSKAMAETKISLGWQT